MRPSSRSATLGSDMYGILSNPFLDRAFQTVSFRMRVTVHDDGTWSYEEHTEMRVSGREGVVDHVDRNTLATNRRADTKSARERRVMDTAP